MIYYNHKHVCYLAGSTLVLLHLLYQLTLLLLGIYQKRKVNSQLLRVYSRLHLSEEDYTFRLNPEGRLLVNKEEEYAAFHDTETFVAQELEEAPVVDFIGWLFSCPTLINPQVTNQLL